MTHTLHRAPVAADAHLGAPLASLMARDAALHVHVDDVAFDLLEVREDPDSTGFRVAAVTRLPDAEAMAAEIIRLDGTDPSDLDAYTDARAAAAAWLRDNADGVRHWLRDAHQVAAEVTTEVDGSTTVRCSTTFRVEPGAKVSDVVARAHTIDVHRPHRALRTPGTWTAMIDAVNAAAAMRRP